MRINNIGIHSDYSVIAFQGCSSIKTSVLEDDRFVPYDGGFHMFMGDVINAVKDTQTIYIMGGEPMDQYADLLEMCRLLKNDGHSVYLYTTNRIDPTKDCYIKLAQYTNEIVYAGKE